VHLRIKGKSEPIDIEALEAVVFKHFTGGVQVQIRPIDTESDVRGRIKSQLVRYDDARGRQKFLGELLAEMLYQVWLYWAVVPEYPRKEIGRYADLCEFAFGLPGKPPCLASATRRAA
jgi:hypothetical protein